MAPMHTLTSSSCSLRLSTLTTARRRRACRADRSAALVGHIDAWEDHAEVWHEASLPKRFLRYEDLCADPHAELTGILGFLMPEIDLDWHPTINRHSIACAVLPNAALEPYRSRKAPFLDSWRHYTDDARRLILDSLGRWWCQCVSKYSPQCAHRCSFGYEELARADGFVTEVDCSAAELALDPLDVL